MFANINAYINQKQFPIIISDNAIKNLNYYLENFDKKNIFIIADKIFQKMEYIPDVALGKIFNNYKTFFCASGIKKKNLKNLIKILNFFKNNDVNKDSKIIIIGGGVIGDMSSFAASIYKRGVNIIHLPTTMTSMVDSCVGGKTGINEFNQVNLLGSYHQPNAIFIDLRFLKTLKKRDFVSGIAESIKKAIIKDKNFYNFLLNNYQKIKKKTFPELLTVVSQSIKIKLELVKDDEKELSSRLLLNYGHTFGQAIESYYGINENKLTHGEAVSLGMICASKLNSLIKNKDLKLMHEKILKLFDLPCRINDIKDLNKPEVKNLLNLIQNDKKKKTKN